MNPIALISIIAIIWAICLALIASPKSDPTWKSGNE